MRSPAHWHVPRWHQPSGLSATRKMRRKESPRPCRGIHGHLSDHAVLLQLRTLLASLLLLRPLPPATTTGTAASRLLRRVTRGIHGVRGHLQHHRPHLAPLRRLSARAMMSQTKTRRSWQLQRVTPGLLIRVIHGHLSQHDRRRRAEDRAHLLHPLLSLATRGRRCRRGRQQRHRLHLVLR